LTVPNRLVEEIRDKHPDWTNNEVFNAARALNEAQWQSIVYHEYLPKLLGSNAIDAYSGYKSGVNPGAGNEWATVAFRFGHDQSSNTDLRIGEDGSLVATVKLGDAFGLGGANRAFGSLNSGSDAGQSVQLDEYMRGLTQRVTQEIDGKVADGNRNALFGITLPDGTPVTVDLEAFDIQRGRDQGVGNLNALREGLGLKGYNNVDQFVGQNNAGNALGQAARAALKGVYGNDINTVDSVVAGLLEKNVKGSMLGETFHLLTVDQFERTRDGDKQFYLNQFKDNPNLIKEIEGTTFAELIMRNTDTTVYHDAFLTYNRTTDNGGSGHDLVLGSAEANTRKGGAGNDDVYGFGGSDRLNGNDGNDLVNGGVGDDTLTGDKGNDIFVFQGACGKDVITDFEKGKDRIDLSDYHLTFADVKAHAQTSGNDVVIDIGAAQGGAAGVDTVTLANAKLAPMDTNYFLFF
jgi:Ca2+-binding RTX toxin-like protein